MEKLYNLYKEVILEATNIPPTIENVQDAINGHYMVNLTYNDGSDTANLNVRYCGIYAIGNTNSNNLAIRVHQASGPNLKANHTGEVQKWKTLILNHIESWSPTKMKFYSPADAKYNVNGDKTLNITYTDGGGNVANFDDKYMDNQRTRHSGWQSNLSTKQQNKPEVRDREVNTTSQNQNQYLDSDYEYTPYEKPEVNNDYPNDEDDQHKENINNKNGRKINSTD